jgi:hypothetical protein
MKLLAFLLLLTLMSCGDPEPTKSEKISIEEKPILRERNGRY